MYKPSEKALTGGSQYAKKTLSAHEVHNVVVSSVNLKGLTSGYIIHFNVRGKEVIENLETKYQTATADIWFTTKESEQSAIDCLLRIANTLDVKDQYLKGLEKVSNVVELVAMVNNLFKDKEGWVATGKMIGVYNDKPFEKGILPVFGTIHNTKEKAEDFLKKNINKSYMNKLDKTAKADTPIGIPQPSNDDLPF